MNFILGCLFYVYKNINAKNKKTVRNNESRMS